MAGVCEGGNEPPGSLKAKRMSNARLIPFEDLSLVTILPIMHVRYLSDYAMNYLALERNRPMQTSDESDVSEMSSGFSAESYPAFVLNELRQNPGKNLNQGPTLGSIKLLDDPVAFVNPTLTGGPSFLGLADKVPSPTDEHEPRDLSPQPLEPKSASETRTIVRIT
ncbi:hypothetical protein ANN_12414 [Periplaneta americana]|uniref:Uncharacterized protein n=1 Tax=Periplaneta americana TaxID=6978 RepID=A0ABQ8TIN9_PERAM|nr:hypothetical protein ANN_12414 [Periplaneta americana]